MLNTTLYASSGTREGIEKQIDRFYCGEGHKVDDAGRITSPSGKEITGTAVEVKRGRYRLVRKEVAA